MRVPRRVPIPSAVPDRDRVFYALWTTAAFLVVVWGVHALGEVTGWPLREWGVRPRNLDRLLGIFTFPFLHGDWEHLWNNTATFFVLNILLFYFYRSIAAQVWLLLYVGSGVLLWATGGQGNHIGASALIYGLAAFLFLSGLIRNARLLMRVSILVLFLYGGMVWWMLPIEDHISWEGHLSGAFVGVVLAWLYRRRGPVPDRYAFETDPEEVPEWYVESERGEDGRGEAARDEVGVGDERGEAARDEVGVGDGRGEVARDETTLRVEG